MSIIDNIREAKRYRASLITRLELQGLSNLSEISLDELELLEKEMQVLHFPATEDGTEINVCSWIDEEKEE